VTKRDRPTIEIFRDGTEVVIQSRIVLRDLVPAKNRKTIVTIAGEEFYLADRGASADKTCFFYRLRPWLGGREIPGRRLYYETAEDFAKEAESRLKEGDSWTVRFLYTLIFPVIGFLHISSKETLEQRFGCSIHRHTFASICVEVAVAVGAATVLTISNIAGTMLAVMYGAEMSGAATILSPNSMLAVIAVCALDAVFRYHHYMEGRCLGFYEWLFRRRKR